MSDNKNMVSRFSTTEPVPIQGSQRPFTFSEQRQSLFFSRLNQDIRNCIYEHMMPGSTQMPLSTNPRLVGFMSSCRLARCEIEEALHHSFRKRLPEWKAHLIEKYHLPADCVFEVHSTICTPIRRLTVYLSDPYARIHNLLLEFSNLRFYTLEVHVVGQDAPDYPALVSKWRGNEVLSDPLFVVNYQIRLFLACAMIPSFLRTERRNPPIDWLKKWKMVFVNGKGERKARAWSTEPMSKRWAQAARMMGDY